MQVHARISREWRRRMIFMFAMIFGSGLWFLSDGYWMWPAETKPAEMLLAAVEEARRSVHAVPAPFEPGAALRAAGGMAGKLGQIGSAG